MRKLVLNGQDLEKPINPDVKSQQADILADVEDKNIGVGNVAYSDAIKDVKKAGEMAAKANKVPQAEEHKEKGENPKMVQGAKKLKLEKLTLDESLFNDDSNEEPKVDVERCKDILNNWIDWEPIDNYEEDVDYAIEQLRSLESEHEITSDEYDYIMSNWDDLLNLNESFNETTDKSKPIKLSDKKVILDTTYDIVDYRGKEPKVVQSFKDRERAERTFKNANPHKHYQLVKNSKRVDDKSLKEDIESFRDEVKKYYDAYRKGIITSSEYGKKFKELKKKHNVKQSDLKDWKNLDEARVSKTKEVAVLQGNYGYGWDDLIEYDVPSIRDYEEYKKVTAEIRQDYKDYQENEQGVAHRIIHRRVPIANESLSKSEYDYQKKYASDTLKFHRDALERARKNKAGKDVEKAIQRHIDDIEDFDKKIDALKEDADSTNTIYCVIRNSEDQGMDKPKFFNNLEKAKAYFDKCVKEEQDYIEDDSDVEIVDGHEDTLDYFGYIDEDGLHEVKLYDNIINENVKMYESSKTLSDSDIKDIKNYCHQYGTRCGVFDRNTGDFYMSTPSGMVKQNYYELKKKYPERFNFKDSLEEGAKTFLRNVDKENEPHTFTHKNRFNYDIKQVRTNPEDKTYEIGQFSYATPRHTTHNGREFDRTIQALRDRGYSEKKKEECVKEDLNKDNIYQYMVFSKDGNNVLEAGPIELNSEEELQDAINNAKDLIAKENVDFILFKGDKIYFNSNEDKPITEGRLPQSPYSHFKNYQRGFNRRTSNKGYKIPLSDRRKEDNDIERRAYKSVRDDIKNQAGEDSIKLAQIAKEKEDEYSKAYNTDSTPENSGKALAASHLRMSADDYNRLHKLNK